MSACSSVPIPQEIDVADGAAAEVSEIDHSIPAKLEYPTAHFDKETLYQLLAAEIAGYRGQHTMALEKYVQITQSSRDPGVAARAARLGTYMKRYDLALQAARVWVEVEPDLLEAHQYAADLMLKNDDLVGAAKEMEAIKKLGGSANFESFAYRASDLSEQEKRSLLATISALLQEFPNDLQLKFSQAVLHLELLELEKALRLADNLLEFEDHQNLVILKINILKKLGRNEEALEFLEEKINGLKDNRRIRLIYARLLFEARKLELAREQYQKELERSPDDGEILFALALICMEQGDDKSAGDYLGKLVRWGKRPGEAHYYLGTLAEKNGDQALALREYRQAGMGFEYIPAQSRITFILGSQGRVAEARAHLARARTLYPEHYRQLIMVEATLLSDLNKEKELFSLLDEVLAENPDDVDMLYFRGMSGEKFGRLHLIEQDLGKIIQLDPNNAEALNALGYTLADRTERYEEALDLITRALRISPDEAAFIDSMGWVQYRLKNFKEALVHLTRALELFPNDEVAAHLGEVLWVSGNKRKARKVWNKGLKLKPDSQMLKKVMEILID